MNMVSSLVVSILSRGKSFNTHQQARANLYQWCSKNKYPVKIISHLCLCADWNHDPPCRSFPIYRPHALSDIFLPCLLLHFIRNVQGLLLKYHSDFICVGQVMHSESISGLCLPPADMEVSFLINCGFLISACFMLIVLVMVPVPARDDSERNGIIHEIYGKIPTQVNILQTVLSRI